MKQFAALLAELDATTRTGEKVAAMASYFGVAAAADAAWAVHFLRGNRPKRLVPVRRLAEWAMAEADVPEWLFNECYEAVGDLAETIALLLPDTGASAVAPLHVWIEQRLLPLRGQDDAVQRRVITSAWRELGGWERFVWNKLITGGFRIGVSDGLVVRALAAALEQEPDVIAQRLRLRLERRGEVERVGP
jgi:DNA ligase 1